MLLIVDNLNGLVSEIMGHSSLVKKDLPELRKQREDKERYNRVGSRITSEADYEEIMVMQLEQV